MSVDLGSGLDPADLGGGGQDCTGILLLDLLASLPLLRGCGRAAKPCGHDRLLGGRLFGGRLFGLFDLGYQLGLLCVVTAVVAVAAVVVLCGVGGQVGDCGCVVLDRLETNFLLGPEGGQLRLACGRLLDHQLGTKVTEEVGVVLPDQPLGLQVLVDRGLKLLVRQRRKVFG